MTHTATELECTTCLVSLRTYNFHKELLTYLSRQNIFLERMHAKVIKINFPEDYGLDARLLANAAWQERKTLIPLP